MAVSNQGSKTKARPSVTAKPSTIRDINRSIVLNLIRLHQPISRASLSGRTGIFRSNVSDIVEELLAENLLVERPGRPSGPGRVPVMLSLNDRGFHVAGISIRPRHTTVGVAGLTGEIQDSRTFPTSAHTGVWLRSVETAVADLLQRAGSKRAQAIRQIAVSVPGFVNAETGQIRWLPQLPGYSDLDLTGELEHRLGVPVAADNDCNLGALAELWLSEADGDHIRDFVFLEIGQEGVGAGIMLDRELYRGHDVTLAAEFGHMIIDLNGPLCTCGRRGCWELYVRDLATFARYRPDTRLTEKRFDEFLDAARAGQRDALASLEETARFLSLGISNIAFALNPNAIVVAGQIRSVWDTIHATIERTFASAKLSVPVRLARLPAEQMFLRGAIHLALSKTFGRPRLGW